MCATLADIFLDDPTGGGGGVMIFSANHSRVHDISSKDTSGYRRLYLCDRFFEQKMAENEDKNTNRLENNGYFSSISLVSVIQILAST